jgi:hypothetical protein
MSVLNDNESDKKGWWDTDRDVKRVSAAMLCALAFGIFVTLFSIDIPVKPQRAAPPAVTGTTAQKQTGTGATGAATDTTTAPAPAPAAGTVRTDISYTERNAMRWAALLWAGACFAVGSFIGFIFGIPRSLSSDTARTGMPAQHTEIDAAKLTASSGNVLENNQAATINTQEQNKSTVAQHVTVNGRGPSTAVNTNLEQISDWLTKIIVGVSLVNSEKIGNNLLHAAGKVADSIGGGPERESLALAIMVYFSVIGLLGGYLLTRLFLQRAFDTAGAEADR